MAIRRFESNGRYSNVVEHNGVLYLTGQLCSNPAADVKQQTKEILEKIESLLEKYPGGIIAADGGCFHG